MKFFIPLFISILLLSGCSYQDQKELQTYLTKMDALSQESNAIIQDYNTIIGQNDVAKEKDFLTNKTIPAYTTYLQKLNQVSVQNKTLQSIHKIKEDASSLQLQVFQERVAALDSKDENTYSKTNDELEQIHTKLDDYKTQLFQYADSIHVNVKSNN